MIFTLGYLGPGVKQDETTRNFKSFHWWIDMPYGHTSTPTTLSSMIVVNLATPTLCACVSLAAQTMSAHSETAKWSIIGVTYRVCPVRYNQRRLFPTRRQVVCNRDLRETPERADRRRFMLLSAAETKLAEDSADGARGACRSRLKVGWSEGWNDEI